jgi:hypothetical protein
MNKAPWLPRALYLLFHIEEAGVETTWLKAPSGLSR